MRTGELVLDSGATTMALGWAKPLMRLSNSIKPFLKDSATTGGGTSWFTA